MTRNDLDAIQARADAATEGPWSSKQSGRNPRLFGIDEPQGYITLHQGTLSRHDAVFIAHARQDVPALVAEIRELRAGRAHVDNPVQNDPTYDDLIASAAVDNATRTDDATDDAGYDSPACDIGPCSRGWDHDGPCA